MTVNIPQEEMDYLEGYGDEGDGIRVIKKYLLTPEQRQGLIERELSLEDVMNGRYPANSEFVKTILGDWNEKLGKKVFYTLGGPA